MKFQTKPMEIIITQNQEQWSDARMRRFTASEIHKLMGTPRNKSENLSETAKSYIYEKAAEILTGNKKQLFGEALSWGIEHEKQAFEHYERISFDKVQYYGGDTYVFIPYGDYSGYSPDGLGDNFILEIKCPFNPAIHLKNASIKNADDLKSIHPEYYWQVQLGMIATKLDNCRFISFDPRFPSQKQIFIADIELQDIKDDIDEKLYYASELLESVILM